MFVGHQDVIRSLYFIGDLDYLASGGKDLSIRIWNINKGKLQVTLDGAHKQLIKCFCYIESKGLLLSGSADFCALKHMQDQFLNE